MCAAGLNPEMVHTPAVAASAATATASRPSLFQPRRSRTSGSFHAGEPFPLPSPYDESTSSNSRPRQPSVADPRSLLRRWSTAKYHTFPTPPPPATPSDALGNPRKHHAWYKRLFGQREEGSGFEDEERHPDHAALDDAPCMFAAGARRRRKRRRRSLATSSRERSRSAHATPLPWTQLGLLALLSLAEQTALNSIGPYLPAMVASFDEIPDGQEGLYVGLLASAFALAQLATNLLWGYFSDRVGRKPTMLLGTSLLMVCFVFFGFCTTYVQLIMAHVAMGLLNGNAAIVPTCLGEITDRTNQGSAFTWLPVVYSLGSLTGPALGGLLSGPVGQSKHPFLVPNIVDAALLLSSVVVLAVWFDETLDPTDPSSGAGPGLGWIEKAHDWCLVCLGRRSKNSRGKDRRTCYRGRQGEVHAHLNEDYEVSGQSAGEDRGFSEWEGDSDGEDGDIKNDDAEDQQPAMKGLRNRNTLAVLGTYLVFQLANISFNSLYPVFASSPPPTGRNLGPGTIGVSLSLAGLATMLFQVFVFQGLKARMGNLGTYRCSLFGMALSMALMPWVSYLDSEPSLGLGTGESWLYGELGVALVLKNICAVGGLSSVMLLVREPATPHIFLRLDRSRTRRSPTLHPRARLWARSTGLRRPSQQPVAASGPFYRAASSPYRRE